MFKEDFRNGEITATALDRAKPDDTSIERTVAVMNGLHYVSIIRSTADGKEK
jgi:hypothetical protein